VHVSIVAAPRSTLLQVFLHMARHRRTSVSEMRLFYLQQHVHPMLLTYSIINAKPPHTKHTKHSEKNQPHTCSGKTTTNLKPMCMTL
jgi:hypothetical protein